MSKVIIRRALLSVSDKTGLAEFAKALNRAGVEIVSTGGTLKLLRDAKIPAVAIDQFTGFPEILEGRVKTLHPKVHGGLLFRRDKKTHRDEAKKHAIQPIDLVVVNLYPFEQVVRKEDVDLEEAIENIDIGGPSMLRSAAKNHAAVTVVCDPADYGRVLEEMTANGGATTPEFRSRLAQKVFQRTSAYDRAIARFLEQRTGAETLGELPERLELSYVRAQSLRYGENPHQRAALYKAADRAPWFRFEQLHGKEISYNNLLDIEATIDVLREFSAPAACVVKHNNPCGIAENASIPKAIELAVECDAMSAFGGIVGLNRLCSRAAAETVLDALKFFEVIVAPSYDAKALEMLRERKNLRIIETGKLGDGCPYDMRFSKQGILLQDRDRPVDSYWPSLRGDVQCVTQVKVDSEGMDDLLFAWKCAKIVRSNAIVLTQGRQTVGIGAGQMSRVDSVMIACQKAGYRTEGACLASDAFFPMPDSIEVAHEHKIKAIIQPGGSVRDADVIAACDRFGIAMVFVGRRHFRH